MKHCTFNYYKNFKCIADKCNHNCCIGWEICIDDDTYELYQNMDSSLGQTIRDNTVCNEGETSFVLDDNERCPMLDENGLCRIIKECGEDALCEICKLHPRYRNYYSDRLEEGLGLCCEEAARVILSQKDKAVLISSGEGELTSKETAFLRLRDNAIDVLQNREISFLQRLEEFEKLFFVEKIEKSFTEISDFYKSLERLDNTWDSYLEMLSDYDSANEELPEEFDTVFEQLSVYFTYRHLFGALDDLRLTDRAKFISLSVKVIRKICLSLYKKDNKLELSTICEVCRMYSSEIEYSSDNILTLMDF